MSAREDLIGYALVALPNEPAFEKCEQLADAYRAEILHEAARLLEAAGYSDDAVNWLDTYADWDPAGLNELFERLGAPVMADAPVADQQDADTLPAWLHWRFGKHGQRWETLTDDDRSHWEHQARAVRRAVARGGFKRPDAADKAGTATP
ncbi:hypothetical protein ACFVYE_32260 [Streptomyces sp. NPDC058239]|uniref:hypothetical protein n=1 Tax=Streptomyces sp. NPDC058239 TaxID=3346395 RepID=UPI0036EA0DE4